MDNYSKILPLTYTNPLTYKIPKNLIKGIKIGQLAYIPLGSKKIKGVILEITNKKPDFITKDIIDIIQKEPILTNTQIEIMKWMSDYYFSTLFQAFKYFFPNNLEKYLKTKTIPNKEIEKEKNNPKKIIIFGDFLESEYIKIFNNHKLKEKQTLILFPDNERLKIFTKYIKNKSDFSFVHGALKPKEKIEEWLKIKSGKAKIIAGTRSAIFSPFLNLGTIIIDKEYEDGFKEERTPKYDTREVAEKMQELTKCLLILQSDIQTVENTYKLNQGFIPYKIKKNNKNRSIQILNQNNFSVIDYNIIDNIEKTLGKNKKIFIFLNKKGNDTFIVCKDCANIPKCKKCQIPMITSQDLLICNHCGLKEKDLTCNKCKSPFLKRLGMGTEKFEKEIKKIFPTYKIKRLDKKTIKNNNIEEFENADIIIGTKMIKKLSFNKVGLLIIYSADAIINLPTYKAPQKIQQSIMSLISKTEDKTKIIIQTINSENNIFQFLKSNGDFFKKELKNLEKQKYPPFYDVIKIIIKGTEKEINQKTKDLRNHFKKFNTIGPLDPYIKKEKVKILIIKTKKNKIFYDKILRTMKNIQIERNPENIF